MTQHDENGFIFGEKLDVPGQMCVWNPDSPDCANPHMAISGESGSGKSYLLRDVIKYLAKQNKHVYVLDLHGDLGVEDCNENYVEFKARKSTHGINPFEFDSGDIDNGGVGVNITTIVTIIKKAFLPNMGAKQESVLRQLIHDTYLVAGIKDDDESTWDRPLPSMESMLELIDQLIEYHTQNSANISQMLTKMDGLRRQLEKLDSAGYFKSALMGAGIGTATLVSSTKKQLATRVDEELDEDEELEVEIVEEEDNDNLEEDDEDETEASGNHDEAIREENLEFMEDVEHLNAVYVQIAEVYGETLTRKIAGKINSIIKLDNDIQFFMAKFRSYCVFGKNQELFGVSLPKEINPKDYESKDILKTLETLRIYISSITTSGIFTDQKPPVKAGLNRLDIHGLPDELKSLFVDTFVNKIFRAMKMRGEYAKQENKTRGDRCSTFIVIDEGRTILPAGKDRDDHRQVINRVCNEARKFGLGLLFVSQSPSHYSNGILSSYTKVVLKTQESEVGKAMKLLGVKDRNLYNRIAKPRTALVGVGRDFIPVGLKGYVRPASHMAMKPSNNTDTEKKEEEKFVFKLNG